MLLELVQGGELFSVLHTDICGRDLDEEDMKFYAACVYLGLEHLHKRDIAYRDLKPENLLVRYGALFLSIFHVLRMLHEC